jgi:glutathione S-transferase
MDLISAGRASFHPTDGAASYSTQKEEGDRVSKVWSETKLQVWLQHFEKVAKRANGNPLAGGANVTAADFAVFHVIDAVSENLMETMSRFRR